MDRLYGHWYESAEYDALPMIMSSGYLKVMSLSRYGAQYLLLHSSSQTEFVNLSMEQSVNSSAKHNCMQSETTITAIYD